MLQLEWASYERNAAVGRDRCDDEVLEGLQPHPNLRELNIAYYGGVTSPNWMKDDRFLMGLKSEILTLEQLQKIKDPTTPWKASFPQCTLFKHNG